MWGLPGFAVWLRFLRWAEEQVHNTTSGCELGTKLQQVSSWRGPRGRRLTSLRFFYNMSVVRWSWWCPAPISLHNLCIETFLAAFVLGKKRTHDRDFCIIFVLVLALWATKGIWWGCRCFSKSCKAEVRRPLCQDKGGKSGAIGTHP